MSFSQESKLAIQQALRKHLPVGGDTMAKLHKNVLQAAGHDEQGQIHGKIAYQLLGQALHNADSHEDEWQEADEIIESSIQIDGTPYSYSARPRAYFDDDEEVREPKYAPWIGFELTFRKGRGGQSISKYFEANVPMRPDGDKQVRVDGAAKGILAALCNKAAHWVVQTGLNNRSCPGCGTMMAEGTPLLTDHGVTKSLHCCCCCSYVWTTPCAKCGSCIGRRQRTWGQANPDLTRCIACQSQ
jgi:hypothetical protein